MNAKQARELFGFDAIEDLLQTESLETVLRRLASDDVSATVPPPARKQG